MKPRLLLLFASALASLAGCAARMESSKIEDVARRAVPVAICLKPLPRHANATVAALTPVDYWSMVLPSYDAASQTVDASSADCSGRFPLASPDLFGAEGVHSSQLRATADDVTIGQGPDGFKIVWLRTHHFADGSAAGPIALVRPKEAYAEVYAIGLYRGTPARSRFAFERLGDEIVVTATDEGCAGVKPNQACNTELTAYVSQGGLLIPGTHFSLDRIQYGQAPGISGQVQYRLTATPVFQEKALRVLEQVVVRDPAGDEIRKANIERVFQLKDRSKLVANNESIWSQIVGQQQAKSR